MEKVVKSEAQWKELLEPEQYHVAREHGTEAPFTGKFYNHKADGTYNCSCCDAPLFTSDTKFDSGTGWPSYFQPITKDAIIENRDESYGMVRVEVLCARCDAHLGHVFPDGPEPTGLRYCINSISLGFKENKN